MASPQYPPPATDRWNLNLPLLIGVVFVFLVGVAVWVIAASGDGDGPSAASQPTGPSSSVATSVPSSTLPSTTSPAPMPDAASTTTSTTSTTTIAPTTAPPTTVPPTTVPPPTTPPPPVTTAAGADPGAVPGDLAIADRPMQAPPCTDSFITIIASAVGDDIAPEGILAYLDDHPGSNYLRTDQTCPSLTPAIDGEPIYVVFLGPFSVAGDACAARADAPQGAYVRRLSTEVGPDHSVTCPDL